MELQLYLEILKRRALVIIITASLSLVVVTAWGLLTPPMYTAYTTVRVLLDMGVIQEPCPLGLTPSASIAVMLAIADADLSRRLVSWREQMRIDFAADNGGGVEL